MTRRATFSKARLARAIGAADMQGKVAVWTASGDIAFLDPAVVPVAPSPPEPAGGNSCDDAFGTGSG